MGWSISWLAVRGKSEEILVTKLGLVPTGEIAEYGDSMFTGRKLPNGWFLLVINRPDHKFLKPNSLERLSQGCEVIATTAEEHVMFSGSELWRDGFQVWRVEHDAQESITHISTSGDLPAYYQGIEQKYTEMQKQAGGSKAGVDYFFEIPMDTAKNIVGFKYDEVDPAIEDGSFMVFEPVSSKSGERKDAHGKKLYKKNTKTINNIPIVRVTYALITVSFLIMFPFLELMLGIAVIFRFFYWLITRTPESGWILLLNMVFFIVLNLLFWAWKSFNED